jgi:hypothetical protein
VLSFYFDTFMAKAEEGDAVAMQRVMEMGGPQMFVRLDGVKEILAEHAELVRKYLQGSEL